jgi:hypothetical protein
VARRVEEEAKYYRKHYLREKPHTILLSAHIIVQRVTTKVVAVYTAAMTGRFSHELILLHKMDEELENLQRRVHETGLRILITSPLELHQTQTTFLAESDILHIVAILPVVSGDDAFHIYEFLTWPIKMPEGTWWTINVGLLDTIVIDHGRTLFRLTSQFELSQCAKIHDISICVNGNVFVKAPTIDKPRIGKEFCLYYILLQNYPMIKIGL